MTQARQAKYCPRCGAMAAREADVCLMCGHQFRTGAQVPSPSSDDELNKTRMFEMPPAVRRADVPPDLQIAPHDRTVRRARLRFFAVPALLIALIAAVVCFLFWWLLR